MNKKYNPTLLNTVVSGPGMKYPRKPLVLIGNDGEFAQGDLMDANAVLEAIDDAIEGGGSGLSEKLDKEIQDRIDAINLLDNAKVNKTDVATTTTPGLIKLYNSGGTNRSGLLLQEDGSLLVNTSADKGLYRDGVGQLHANIKGSATNEDIEAGTSTDRALTPSNIAVLKSIITADNSGRITSIENSLSGYVTGGSYNSTTKRIELKHNATVIASIDATDFIVDGMVDDVRIENGNLVIDFNTASGKQDIEIPLTDIFNPSNYYTKSEVNNTFVATSTLNRILLDKANLVNSLVPDAELPKADAAGTTTGIVKLRTNGQGANRSGLTIADGGLTVMTNKGLSIDGVGRLNATIEGAATTEEIGDAEVTNKALTPGNLSDISNWVRDNYVYFVEEGVVYFVGLDEIASAVKENKEAIASLATVATSGDYNDLINKPSFSQVQSDWNQTDTTAADYIKNKPVIPAGSVIDLTLSTTSENAVANKVITTALNNKVNGSDLAVVATSGSYTDLSNKPTIPTVPTNVSAFNNDAGYLTEHQDISGKANTADLSTVATSGSYNDLSDKPTIPAAVTETTVSNWGFTKNTGTYSKPTGGIPKTDLATAVQTSLGKADTALQSYTETDPTVPAWAKASSKPTYSYSEITNTPTLATVATSGSYNDLSNKPTILTAASTQDVEEGLSTTKALTPGNMQEIADQMSALITFRREDGSTVFLFDVMSEYAFWNVDMISTGTSSYTISGDYKWDICSDTALNTFTFNIANTFSEGLEASIYFTTGATPNISFVSQSSPALPIYIQEGFEFEANSEYEVSIKRINNKIYIVAVKMEALA